MNQSGIFRERSKRIRKEFFSRKGAKTFLEEEPALSNEDIDIISQFQQKDITPSEFAESLGIELKPIKANLWKLFKQGHLFPASLTEAQMPFKHMKLSAVRRPEAAREL